MSDPIKKIVTPIHLEFHFTPGHAATPFLHALKEGRIMGQRCPKCSKVYVPPRGSCAACAVATEEEVEVADRGIITTFCVVNVPFYGQVMEMPYVCASVLLDGADIATFFLIQETPVPEIRMGMRVEAVWAPPEERKPSIEAIKYFRATGEPDAPYDRYKEYL